MTLGKYLASIATVLLVMVAVSTIGSQALAGAMVETKYCPSGECDQQYHVNSEHAAFQLNAYCGSEASPRKPHTLHCSSPNSAITCSQIDLADGKQCTCNHKQQKTTYKVNTKIEDC